MMLMKNKKALVTIEERQILIKASRILERVCKESGNGDCSNCLMNSSNNYYACLFNCFGNIIDIVNIDRA